MPEPNFKILVADDDEIWLRVIDAVLRKSGWDVISVDNGTDALELLLSPEAPSLAILDWMMPGLNGFDVLRRVRAACGLESLYVLMLTAKTDKSDLVSGLDAGANDYLTKPFDPGELRARVEVGRRMVEMQNLLAAKVDELNQALLQIRTLRGIVPICSWCKKIRDDKGYWNQVESYIQEHTEAEFSHGICPGCLRELYQDCPVDDKSPV